MKKPVVHLEDDRGTLRLRWTFNGSRYSMGLGMLDTKTNRSKAQYHILAIEADMEAGRFDPSLQKYRKATAQTQEKITFSQLFDKWATSLGKRNLDSRTKTWDKTACTLLINYLKSDSPACHIDKNVAVGFQDWLYSRGNKPLTVKRRFEVLASCWRWAVEEKILTENPWQPMLCRIRIPQKPMPQPFSKEEIARIIDGFQCRYSALVPLIKFLFGTGCRTGEALGLRWCDVSPSCDRCVIATQWTNQKRKAPKAGKIRTLFLSSSIQQVLLEQKKLVDSELVFFSEARKTYHD